jgi:hypothetical protein
MQLNDHADVIRWKLHQHGRFSLHLLYLALISNLVIERNKVLYKVKLSLKIKVFMWFMYKEVVRTKYKLFS